MTIAQILRILWAWRIFIALSTIGCCLIAVGMAMTLAPRYEASARVEIDLIQPDPITGEVISNKFAEAYAATQIQLIRDYAVAGRVVDASGLLNSPQMAQQYRASGASTRMDFRRWLSDQMIGGSAVRLIEGTNILEIRFAAPDPAMASAFADLLRSAYIDQSIAFNRNNKQQSADWLTAQADRLREELAQAQAAKAEYERANNIVINRDSISTDEIRLRSLVTTPPSAHGRNTAETIVAPSSNQLAQLEAAIATASTTLGPNHPRLQQMIEQRRVLQAAVEREIAAARSAPAAEGPSVQAAYERQLARVQASEPVISEARRLAADAAVLEDEYARVSSRAAELRLEAQSLEAGVTPIGVASTPTRMTYPDMPLVTGLSASFGLALGILTALLIELLGIRVRGADDLQIAAVPVLNAASQTADPDPAHPATSAKRSIAPWRRSPRGSGGLSPRGALSLRSMRALKRSAGAGP